MNYTKYIIVWYSFVCRPLDPSEQYQTGEGRPDHREPGAGSESRHVLAELPPDPKRSAVRLLQP